MGLCVIVSSFGQIEQGQNKEILDLLNEESVLERTVVELVYEFDEESTMCV